MDAVQNTGVHRQVLRHALIDSAPRLWYPGLRIAHPRQKEVFMKLTNKLIPIFLMAALLAGLCAPALAAHTDVAAGAWYYAAVEEATNLGLMDTLEENRFAPETAADRGAVVEALWRLDGKPACTNELPFTDMDGARYVDSVRWSYANGVVNGTSDTTFSPTNSVTRAQLTTLLHRYLSYKGVTPTGAADLSAFPDAAQVPDWAQDAMAWACGAGIIQGTASGGTVRLDPGGTATRAQLATVILRFRNQFLDNPAEDEAYKSIAGRKVETYTTRYFGLPDSAHALFFKYPSDWTLEEAEGAALTISRAGQSVGTLQSGAADTRGWKIVSSRTISYNDYCTWEYIEKAGTGSALRFRYRYCHEFTENGQPGCFTVILDPTEMSDDTRYAMYSNTELRPAASEPGMGRFSDLKDKKLLLLGNSFISTSEIGATLKDIFRQNGSGCSVNAISRGYATVKTFAQDTSLMSAIRGGSYDAVFLCGLYSASEVDYVNTVKQACDASGTRLILMPAYNESRAAINQAARTYPTLEILDWKGEIEDFIYAGKNKWDFCINDQHTHSTPLAGYVGAHMIYRGIYGKVPSAGTGSVSQTLLDRVLGDYTDTGILRHIAVSDITVLN